MEGQNPPFVCTILSDQFFIDSSYWSTEAEMKKGKAVYNHPI